MQPSLLLPPAAATAAAAGGTVHFYTPPLEVWRIVSLFSLEAIFQTSSKGKQCQFEVVVVFMKIKNTNWNKHYLCCYVWSKSRDSHVMVTKDEWNDAADILHFVFCYPNKVWKVLMDEPSPHAFTICSTKYLTAGLRSAPPSMKKLWTEFFRRKQRDKQGSWSSTHHKIRFIRAPHGEKWSLTGGYNKRIIMGGLLLCLLCI